MFQRRGNATNIQDSSSQWQRLHTVALGAKSQANGGEEGCGCYNTDVKRWSEDERKI